ncbi:zinc finger protein 892 [Trichomycterus rosablanca]|uniref:zinc finger protein 892 n=1 Tax=Trichomycterus rosablanca TaxID=2290929 RepID=UPI002F35ABA7
MSQCGFQEQLLSVVEVLAKAATEEINRRVEENCAVIRIELSRSQRDIDHLKKKCLLMENELRKVRGRARRKVFICGSSEKMPFQSVCARETNVCRAEATVTPTQQDLEPSTQHIHQTIPNLEEHSKAIHSVIKVEGTSNELWSSEEGQFAFEHHGNEPRDQVQETPVEQNRFTEATDRLRTNFTSASSPVKSHEENLNHLRLHLKTEKEEEEQTEVREAALVEETEPRPEDTDHPNQFSCNLSGFSQPAETMELSKNDATCAEKNQIGLYMAEQTQPAWCRVVTHESDHMVQRHDVPVAHQQQHRTLPPPRESGVRPGISYQTGAFLGRGRGGLRRFRSQWITNVNGERRFSCSYCERTFVRFGQLKEHLRSHTGERPYTCTQCGRSFTKQGNLIRHAVVHSGEKPYQCNLCGKCFTQRSSMKSHQKTHMSNRDSVMAGLAARQTVREQQDSLVRTHTGHFV